MLRNDKKVDIALIIGCSVRLRAEKNPKCNGYSVFIYLPKICSYRFYNWSQSH